MNHKSIYSLLKHSQFTFDLRPILFLNSILLGSLGESFDVGEDAFLYSDIPHFPISTAPSHKSRLLFGRLKGVPILLMQGRFHLYEGYSIQTVSTPCIIKMFPTKITLNIQNFNNQFEFRTLHNKNNFLPCKILLHLK